MALAVLKRYTNGLWLAWLALLWLLPLVARGQNAGCVNVVWNLQDFIGTPQAVQRLILSPLSPAAGVGVNSTNILIPTPNSRPTAMNGSVTISNVVTGYGYRIQLLSQSQQVLATFTNYFATNLSGTVNAATALGTNYGPVFGWIFAPQYVAVGPGTNVAFSTNSGVLSINSTGVGNIVAGTNITVQSNATAVTINAANNGSGTPLILDPVTGLYHRIWIYDDNGVLTLQVPTAGFNPGTPSYPTVALADPDNTNLYHNLYAYNDNGVFSIQVADADYTPGSVPAVPFLLDYSTYFAHTLALFDDNGVLAIQISDTDY